MLNIDHGSVLADLADWMDEVIDIPLSKEDVALLADIANARRPASELTCLSDTVWEQCDEARAAFDAPLFVRNSFCSFKPVGGVPTSVFNASQLRSLFGLRNGRVGAVLDKVGQEHKALSLFASPWKVIPPWAEFRAFIYHNDVIGISQYHRQQSYVQINARAEQIEHDLRSALNEIVANLRYENCVIDLFWQLEPEGDVNVIEVNPFLTATDACLFTWRDGGDFDYSFRYHQQT